MLRMTPQYRAESLQRYFVEALCKDDYYSKGTEEPGLWRGQAADKLGLSGRVDRHTFSRLTENQHPFKDERLTPRNRDGRRVGYDITFSPPKSVSVLYAITRDEDVLWAFRTAVRDTMQEMERSMATRVRLDGANHDRPTGNMVWAEYLHFTTRPVNGEPDPHLHIHNFAVNCTFDEQEQRFKAGQFGLLKARAPYFQALALSKLAANLVSTGYQIERTEHAFEIVGVPLRSLSEFSRRTHIIESIAGELGFEQERKATLGAKTRERKTDAFTLDQLHERWAARLSASDIETIRGAKGRPLAPEPDPAQQPPQGGEHVPESDPRTDHQPGPDHERTGERRRRRRWRPLLAYSATKAVRLVLEELFERDAIVSRDKVLERALHLAVGKADVEQLQEAIDRHPGLVKRTLGDVVYLTTREAVAEERELVRFAREGRNSMRPLGGVALSLSQTRLDDYERAVLGQLLESTDRITLFKNTGPTRTPELTRAAMTAVQQHGHKLVVVAPNAASARQAEKDYGITDAQTVHQVLANDEHNSIAKNIVPKVFRTVFWVEDAGRMGTRTVARLAAIANRTGARLVLSGNEKRSRKFERGDPFRPLRDDAGLQTVERRVLLERQSRLERAVDALEHEPSWWSVNTLEELGKLTVLPGSEGVHKHAAEFFVEHERKGRSALLVTPTQSRANVLTDAVRAKLRAEKRLKGKDKSTVQYVSAGLSDAEKHLSVHYRRGMVIDFFRPTRGFKAGDRTKVFATDPVNGVWVWGKAGTLVRLNLSHADRFTVSTTRRAKLAVGDRIRLTKHTRALIGKPLKSGSVVTVTGFNPFGQVAVSGGRLLAKSFGHFEHDYVTTCSRLHGRRADAVAFVADREGWRGAEAKDIAAAGEAARTEFRVVVGSREQLADTLAHERPVLNAKDLEDDPDLVDVELSDYAYRFRRTHTDDQRGFRYGE